MSAKARRTYSLPLRRSGKLIDVERCTKPKDLSASEAPLLAAVHQARDVLRPASHAPLSRSDIVMAMQLWNKTLAFQASFAEALALQWRVECCELLDVPEKDPLRLVHANRDPLTTVLSNLLPDLPNVLVDFLDAAVRAVCPHEQTVLREAYRPLADGRVIAREQGAALSLECESLADYCNLFAAHGLPADAVVALVRATLWAIGTHTPYAQTDDEEDLERGMDSAIGKVVTQRAAMPILEALEARISRASDPIYSAHLPCIWNSVRTEERRKFAEYFFKTLFGRYPDLVDCFSVGDVDMLTQSLFQSVKFIVQSSRDIMGSGFFRRTLERLGVVLRQKYIPTYAFPLIGVTLVEAFQPYFDRAVGSGPGMPGKEKLRAALLLQYRDVMTVVHYPILRQEKLMKSAREFLTEVGKEAGWSSSQLDDRMHSVRKAVIATGTYTHTSEELKIGARLAWRNSSKCIGRISWNTLEVRDCRHVNDVDGMFKELGNHLRIATAGTNIQSVMTVFKPQAESEALGTRFWSAQIHRYAAYKNQRTGSVLGDIANLELTEYLVKNGLWKPPEPQTAFDVLPVVLKRTGQQKPDVYKLPEELIFEVDIEHPSNDAITALKYKWCTVPAICNFKMTLGGVTYANIPFNGWFMSTEIVRNIMERYNAGASVAAACGLDMQKDPFWRHHVTLELERAVVHSFNKRGYTIVDPMSVGQSFCTHVQRERERHGRECPAQWSWIGGLVGPTNPTWHLEMRDFLLKPQYDYCLDGLKLHNANHPKQRETSEVPIQNASEQKRVVEIPQVLIAYGSETGNAESAARKLKRELRILKPTLCSLNDVTGLSVIAERNITHVLCICSTFGNGEPPSNARRFFEESIASTNASKFAVLGLGSTVYPNFCKAGDMLDGKLEFSGLDRLCDLTKADDAVGSEVTISDWIKLITSLVITPDIEKQLSVHEERDSRTENRIKWCVGSQSDDQDFKKPKGVLCLSNTEQLPGLDPAEGSVRRIVFKAPSPYVTGDHVSVQPFNAETDVQRFLNCFRRELCGTFNEPIPWTPLKWNSVVRRAGHARVEVETVENDKASPADVSFPMPTTLDQVVREKLDLSFTKSNVVELLTCIKELLDDLFKSRGATKASALKIFNDDAVQLSFECSKIVDCPAISKCAAVEDFKERFVSVMEFFEHYGSVLFGPIADQNGMILSHGPLLKLADVLITLQPLKPRYYSISSSNKVTPDEVTITVGVMRLMTRKGKEIRGVCSNYLAALVPGRDRAHVEVKTSNFRLPKSISSPMIMVGAGTGLSPLMGFLDERGLSKVHRSGGDIAQLFFGCRTKKHFIYKDKLAKHERGGVVKVHLALSRAAGRRKQYVQDRISAKEELIGILLLQDDVHYYVCGDARMADACFETCVGILRRKAGMNQVSAMRHLKRMQVEGRWQTDVWGIVPNRENLAQMAENSKRASTEAWTATFREI